jgi:hypothetical protein
MADRKVVATAGAAQTIIETAGCVDAWNPDLISREQTIEPI